MSDEYDDKTPLKKAAAAIGEASASAEAPPPAYVPPIIPPHLQQEMYQQRPGQQSPHLILIQPTGNRIPIGVGRTGIPLDDWQIGMCDGCYDIGNWLLSCCCPCFLACKAAQRLDESPLFPFICGIYPLNVRFRSLVGIKQSMLEEGLQFCLCPSCSLLRLVNEMDERGFDMQRS